MDALWIVVIYTLKWMPNHCRDCINKHFVKCYTRQEKEEQNQERPELGGRKWEAMRRRTNFRRPRFLRWVRIGIALLTSASTHVWVLRTVSCTRCGLNISQMSSATKKGWTCMNEMLYRSHCCPRNWRILGTLGDLYLLADWLPVRIVLEELGHKWTSLWFSSVTLNEYAKIVFDAYRQKGIWRGNI